MAEPVGMWVGPHTYRMYDSRTQTTKHIAIMSIDGLPSAPEEIADIVEEYKERFAAECAAMPDHQVMPKSQQHDFAPHLRDIEASNHRRYEVGHGKYW